MLPLKYCPLVIFVMFGIVVSVMTCELSVVDVIVFQLFPNISSKSMLKLVIHCVSQPTIVYVPLRSVHDPDTLTLFPAIAIDTHVRSSLQINDTVIVSHTFANHELLFDEVMCTQLHMGLVPNDVKCSVSKLHSCWMPVRTLPVHSKLLTILELVNIFP